MISNNFFLYPSKFLNFTNNCVIFCGDFKSHFCWFLSVLHMRLRYIWVIEMWSFSDILSWKDKCSCLICTFHYIHVISLKTFHGNYVNILCRRDSWFLSCLVYYYCDLIWYITFSLIDGGSFRFAVTCFSKDSCIWSVSLTDSRLVECLAWKPIHHLDIDINVCV